MENLNEENKPVLVKRGVANTIEGTIYIHEQLEAADKELYDFVVGHELAHVDIERTAFQIAAGKGMRRIVAGHILHDLVASPVKMFLKTLKFSLTHKGAAWQLSPVRLIYLPDKNYTAIMFDYAGFLAIGFMALTIGGLYLFASWLL
jgi:hypothetical protein